MEKNNLSDIEKTKSELVELAKKTFSKDEEVYYHGRAGKVVKYDGGGYIVYFSDIDDEQWIDKDELIEQNS